MASWLNIAALSQRTGVPAETLRKWEQRYGVLRPERTPGGQRRYSEVDVARVEWLRERLAEGYRIGEAAALLGGVEVEAARTPAELRRALLDAVSASDVASIEALLDQALTVFPLEQTLSRIVAPVLERVGEWWSSGEVSVAQEHLFTAAVRARLDRRLADARGGVRGVAVLACVPGERHEIGLLMLAALLRADGWQIAYLGPDAPLDDAAALTTQLEAPLLALSMTMAENGVALTRPAVPRGTTVVLGGSGATPRVARKLGATLIDDGLRRAVRELRRAAR